MRINQRGEACYSSFEELASALNVKPVNKAPKDQDKFDKLKKDFQKRHKCKGCGMPLTYIDGTNIVTCTNPECKGEKHALKTDDGATKVWYTVCYDSLDNKGVGIAQTLIQGE